MIYIYIYIYIYYGYYKFDTFINVQPQFTVFLSYSDSNGLKKLTCVAGYVRCEIMHDTLIIYEQPLSDHCSKMRVLNLKMDSGASINYYERALPLYR